MGESGVGELPVHGLQVLAPDALRARLQERSPVALLVHLAGEIKTNTTQVLVVSLSYSD